jgi:DNA-binding Lrp family transcriptional regulator
MLITLQEEEGSNQMADSSLRGNPSSTLDDVDLKILRIIAVDARRSARSISREIGMSPGAVTERITKLEQSGIVRGYRAEISPEALGYDLQVLIGLQVEQGEPLDETIERLLSIPEITSVMIVTGRWDLVLQIQAAGHKHLQSLLLDQIWQIQGFRHSETMLSLGRYEQPAHIVNPLGFEDEDSGPSS